MKLRKQKKKVPAWFRKQLYEQYKVNMTTWNIPIKPYKEWLIETMNIKIPPPIKLKPREAREIVEVFNSDVEEILQGINATLESLK